MYSRPFSVLVTLLLVSWALALDSLPSPNQALQAEKQTFWFIPHTHWEGAVFKTREEFLQMGLPNILKVLNLLKKYPNYRFVLDQVAYVRPFLERYPEEEETFRKFLAEGRLQLVGGMDIMPDDNMPGGEHFIRQLQYGKGYYREKLNGDVTVGWLLDTFGHHAQMPQILKLAGFKSFWFFRGVSSLDVPSEFLWQGIDGTEIPAFWLPRGYAVVYGSPKSFVEFDRFMRERFDSLGRFARGPDRVGLAGADVSDPEEHVPALLEEFNRQHNAPFTLRFGLPTEFESVVAKRTDRQIIKGELNPIFQGIYSSRIELKQWYRSLEALLTSAEKLASLASWLGQATDSEGLARAWEPVLFNVTHDLASGVMTDHVYEDTLRGYEFSERLGDQMVDSWLQGIGSKVDTRGEGVPILIFNTLGWERTDKAEVDVGFSEGGLVDLSAFDSDGQPVPVQLLTADRYSDGGIKQARITFTAHRVPPLGYSIYRVVAKRSLSGESTAGKAGEAIDYSGRWWSGSTAQQDSASIENEYYRATFNLWTGEMTSLINKDGNWEALSGPANVVAREPDGGDFWELYGTLHGGRNIAMTKKQGPPDPAKAFLSSQQVGGSGKVQPGPVFSEYSVNHPFGSGHFGTTVRLYNGIRRVEITTKILNNERYVRYRAVFPTSIRNGKSYHEIPFGAIERPAGVELPAQNWVDYGDGSRGVGLLNRGIPGNNLADAQLMLSLLRSATIGVYSGVPHGGFEPGISSDSGLELGKVLTLQYALVPHNSDWREAGMFRAGMELNQPLIARKLLQHAGVLPKRWGLLEVSYPNVVTASLKQGRDGMTFLRVYEATGKACTGVKVKLNAKIGSAYEANLIEDLGRKVDTPNETLQFDLAPYQIKTFALQLVKTGN
jgi:alpha-mannosidase